VTPTHVADEIAATYVDLRPLLFSIAYRMLGSVGEAEDLVQESFIRYQRAIADGSAVESPRAYLSAVVTRLAIDQLKSARVRREAYVGEWLPEPLVTDDAARDPAAVVEQADSLSMSFLLLMERLTPVERAVFLLHDVFDYDFREVGAIVGRSPATCRQHAVRARRFVADNRPRFDADERERDQLMQGFLAAAERGDVAGLISLLADDVVVHGDGGGKVPQWSNPIEGAARVARMFAGLGAQLLRIGGTAEARRVNGQPGIVFRGPHGGVFSVMAFEFGDGRVAAVHSIVNPAKLAHLGAVESLRDVLDEASGSAVAATRRPSGGPHPSGNREGSPGV
jgi:RNA polymerase sigma-70 factor (ECF subfamily)